MTDCNDVYNKIKILMCSRCNLAVRSKCWGLDLDSIFEGAGQEELEQKYKEAWSRRYRQTCICIQEILTPNDNNYPTGIHTEINHEQKIEGNTTEGNAGTEGHHDGGEPDEDEGLWGLPH